MNSELANFTKIPKNEKWETAKQVIDRDSSKMNNEGPLLQAGYKDVIDRLTGTNRPFFLPATHLTQAPRIRQNFFRLNLLDNTSQMLP